MKIIFRPLFLGLFVFWVFFPFLSIIIWSVAAGWRFPDLLPEQYSARGYEVSFDPDGDIVRGVITSTVIALIVGVLATAIGSAAGRAIAARSSLRSFTIDCNEKNYIAYCVARPSGIVLVCVRNFLE